MTEKMIDAPETLMVLSEDELTEKMLEPTYNGANLRELVRRCIRKLNEYKTAFQYQVEKNQVLEEENEQLKRMLRPSTFESDND